MHQRASFEQRTAGAETGEHRAVDAELSFFRDVLKHLPAGVTVQDEHGRLLLVNDVAADQLGMSQPATSSSQLDARLEIGRELLQAGREAVMEEPVDNGGESRQVLLTSHR